MALAPPLARHHPVTSDGKQGGIQARQGPRRHSRLPTRAARCRCHCRWTARRHPSLMPTAWNATLPARRRRRRSSPPPAGAPPRRQAGPAQRRRCPAPAWHCSPLRHPLHRWQPRPPCGHAAAAAAHHHRCGCPATQHATGCPPPAVAVGAARLPPVPVQLGRAVRVLRLLPAVQPQAGLPPAPASAPQSPLVPSPAAPSSRLTQRRPPRHHHRWRRRRHHRHRHPRQLPTAPSGFRPPPLHALPPCWRR